MPEGLTSDDRHPSGRLPATSPSTPAHTATAAAFRRCARLLRGTPGLPAALTARLRHDNGGGRLPPHTRAHTCRRRSGSPGFQGRAGGCTRALVAPRRRGLHGCQPVTLAPGTWHLVPCARLCVVACMYSVTRCRSWSEKDEISTAQAAPPGASTPPHVRAACSEHLVRPGSLPS